MKRWLVIFSSHPTPPFDQTAVSLYARTMLDAIVEAKTVEVSHRWSMVRAIPWPRGAKSIDAATARAFA